MWTEISQLLSFGDAVQLFWLQIASSIFQNWMIKLSVKIDNISSAQDIPIIEPVTPASCRRVTIYLTDQKFSFTVTNFDKQFYLQLLFSSNELSGSMLDE